MLQNRLYDLYDGATHTTGADIVAPAGTFDNSSTGVNQNNNYKYDELGNLIADTREEIGSIHWTVAGKVKRIARTAGSSKPSLVFAYGADGQRISKTVGNPTNGGYKEYYIRDAQGNIMATYKYTNSGSAGASLMLTERPIYGSSRIGSHTQEMEMVGSTPPQYYPYIQPMHAPLKRYELTDHLGNVATVVTGKLLPGNGAGSAYQADVVSAQGYEAGGSLLPGRNYSSSSYAHGFNGMRKDDEVHGSTGTSYDFGARMYDPRVGRWLSLDPLAAKYPNISPYAFSENNPIFFNDPTGKDAEVTIVGNTVTVTAVIKVYGSGATAAKASEIQASINGYWQAAAHTYTDAKTGQVYNVKFNAVVQMYDPENPGAEPGFFSGRNNPFSTDNFIRLTTNQEEQNIYNKAAGLSMAGGAHAASFVSGGDEGVWRADLDADLPGGWAHEFGHLLGEPDVTKFVRSYQWTDDEGVWRTPKEYQGNIMSYQDGPLSVGQVNVDNIVAPAVNEYMEKGGAKYSGGCCTPTTEVPFKTKIDPGQ